MANMPDDPEQGFLRGMNPGFGRSPNIMVAEGDHFHLEPKNGASWPCSSTLRAIAHAGASTETASDASGRVGRAPASHAVRC